MEAEGSAAGLPTGAGWGRGGGVGKDFDGGVRGLIFGYKGGLRGFLSGGPAFVRRDLCCKKISGFCSRFFHLVCIVSYIRLVKSELRMGRLARALKGLR